MAKNPTKLDLLREENRLLKENAALKAGGTVPLAVKAATNGGGEELILHPFSIDVIQGEDGKVRLDIGGVIPTKRGAKERKFRVKASQALRISSQHEALAAFVKVNPSALD